MDCAEIRFSGHAIRRMFERGLGVDDVRATIENGEVIVVYPDDKPYPSCLMLGAIRNRTVHAVVAKDPISAICQVITAYCPDPELWSDDFRTRRST